MIDVPDLARLTEMLSKIEVLDTGEALELLLGGDSETAAELAGHCTAKHIALVVFPDRVSEVVDFLRLSGLTVGEPVPSTLVRARLADRYGRASETLSVSIVTGVQPSHPYHALEVFVVPGVQNRTDENGIAARERLGAFETHIAFETAPESLDIMRKMISRRTSLRADGGGHNSFEQARQGGRSVFYFAISNDGNTSECGFRRLELFCKGNRQKALAEHSAEYTARRTVEHVTVSASRTMRTMRTEPETRLLELVTGHITTKALSVTVELGIADALAASPLTGSQVASVVGAEPSAVTRLLRYLAGFGVVAVAGDHYASTPILELLRRESDFAELTLLYGGEFFTAWGEFGHAVRTGASAFGQVFGLEHFEYFKEHPELGGRFNRAMAASTKVLIARLSGAYDFSSARRVVDIGGGDGTLLRAILDRAPAATGVLFDRKNVITAGSVTTQPGSTGAVAATDRVELVEGDFFDEVPAHGDLYILSRVLHDWNDEQCGRLLGRCRAAMRPGTTLLAIERVLSDEFVSSPARTWDLQMLAITGGRERTRDEYARMMADTGFALETVIPVWHGLSLLVTRAA